MGLWQKRLNKYGAKKVSLAGYTFASKLEAALFNELSLRKLAGEIKEIQCQDTVYLTDARIMYKPDFRCVMADDSIEWFEAKGMETPEWRIKLRLYKHYGPGKLTVYGGSYNRLVVMEVVHPKGANNGS